MSLIPNKLILTEGVITDFAVWQQIHSRLEIGGYGRVSIKDDTFICDKIWFLTESHSSASMRISEAGMSDFMFKMIDEGEDWSSIYLHWHSHPDFTPYFSPTDVNDIREHLQFSPKLLTVVFSTVSKIVARYNTREGYKDLPVSLKLNKYYQAFKVRPNEQRFYKTNGYVSPDKTRGHYDYWNGPSGKLDNPSPQSDGFWIQRQLHQNMG